MQNTTAIGTSEELDQRLPEHPSGPLEHDGERPTDADPKRHPAAREDDADAAERSAPEVAAPEVAAPDVAAPEIPTNKRAANKNASPHVELPDIQVHPVRESWHAWLLRQLSSLLFSFVLHASLLIALAVLSILHHSPRPEIQITCGPGGTPEGLQLVTVETGTTLDTQTTPTDSATLAAAESATVDPVEVTVVNLNDTATDLPINRLLSGLTAQELLVPVRSTSGGGFEGRRRERRVELLRANGGTPESEEAVARGLAWLAAHQMKKGGWRFDHAKGTCNGRCRNIGTEGSSTAATAIALLPFLGAGHTPDEGEYRDTVYRGLYYLTSRGIHTQRGADLQEGTMYGQGLATLALCEAYAMTGDDTWKAAAQDAINFIANVQHTGGGWRYYPGQPGDATVTGWQLMALKSGRLAGLKVPYDVIDKADRFLKSLQSSKEVGYGYIRRGKLPTPTAVCLLMRMYLGLPHDDPHLLAGVRYLAGLRPSKQDMYFNYYATQVLHHFGDAPMWDRWNSALRDYLVETQSDRGHEQGSWFFDDPHGKVGGRLYTTAACVMILEVYYRHLPLYGVESVEGSF